MIQLNARQRVLVQQVLQQPETFGSVVTIAVLPGGTGYEPDVRKALEIIAKQILVDHVDESYLDTFESAERDKQIAMIDSQIAALEQNKNKLLGRG